MEKYNILREVLAELSRAKRAQRSTMGKKIGNLCIREILVVT